MTPLTEIILYFEENEIIDHSIEISSGATVEDPSKMIKSHISILKSNPGNPIYLPYYERLNELHKYHVKKNTI